MDVIRLRYLGPAPVMVAALGVEVEPDNFVEFPGELVEENDDHYLIEQGNPVVARAWPKSRWRDESVRTATKTAKAAGKGAKS